MNLAREKAAAMKHGELDPLHLLWAFLREAALPVAQKTVIPNPNSRLRELILRAAELAAVTDSLDEEAVSVPMNWSWPWWSTGDPLETCSRNSK